MGVRCCHRRRELGCLATNGLIDAGVGLEDALLFAVLPVDLGNLCFGGACRMQRLCWYSRLYVLPLDRLAPRIWIRGGMG
jgi:hypothetical protein